MAFEGKGISRRSAMKLALGATIGMPAILGR